MVRRSWIYLVYVQGILDLFGLYSKDTGFIWFIFTGLWIYLVFIQRILNLSCLNSEKTGLIWIIFRGYWIYLVNNQGILYLSGLYSGKTGSIWFIFQEIREIPVRYGFLKRILDLACPNTKGIVFFWFIFSQDIVSMYLVIIQGILDLSGLFSGDTGFIWDGVPFTSHEYIGKIHFFIFIMIGNNY